MGSITKKAIYSSNSVNGGLAQIIADNYVGRISLWGGDFFTNAGVKFALTTDYLVVDK